MVVQYKGVLKCENRKSHKNDIHRNNRKAGARISQIREFLLFLPPFVLARMESVKKTGNVVEENNNVYIVPLTNSAI